MITRSLGAASTEVFEVGGHREEVVCLVAGIRKVWGQKGTSELHLGKQGEKVLIGKGALQEDVLVSKARQN